MFFFVKVNDGNPISGTNQSFMVDNMFNYHLDKAAKMGAEWLHRELSSYEWYE